MFKVFSNAWKIPDVRKKILYTLFILLIYRIGCYVPVPGVDIAYVAEKVSDSNLFSFINLFSGGSLEKLTMFSLGVIPYINSSIIMQLLTVAIPALERMNKDEDGRKKIASITRYVAVALGLVQAVGVLFGLGSGAVLNNNWFSYVTIVLCLTAGTALIMWLGERINERGIGNGISLLIFIGIIARLPQEAYDSIISGVAVGSVSILTAVLILVGAVAIIFAITFVDMGERRIPVQYAKRVVGRKTYGGQSTYIPMKVNQSGVLPLIFAMTFIQFPSMIGQFWPESGFYIWYQQWISSGNAIYMVVYALLILFFTYFYSQISFNAVDVSKNMQQYGGFIPGIRPGKSTSDYLQRILNRITLFGALFLALVAAIPVLFTSTTGLNTSLGATSLLIMVNVALETTKQIESQLMMRHYKGFLG